MSLSHPTPELLLSEMAWLRSLGRRLTGDADRAADLQQDVALAALTQPPNASIGRSWLATVARNLAAMLRRSRAREQQRLRRLPEREPVPSPDALAADAELQRHAVAAVLALPVVYRDTVLLRFMHGLSLQATAAAMAVPEETVRTRQKRALTMLREQLGTSDDRRGATALFGSLIAWGIAMKVKHVVAAAAVLLVALLVAVPLWPNGTNAAPSSPATSPTAALADLGSRAHAGVAADAKMAVPARTELEATAGAAPIGHASLTVRVWWREGNAPAAGMPVLCQRAAETGTFALTDDAGEAVFTDLAPDTYTVHTTDWFQQAVVVAPGAHATLEHTMARGYTVTGVVFDAAGTPVAGATILVSTAGCWPQWSFPAASSDAQGRFACRGLRNGSLVGARDGRHGTSEFWMLRDSAGVTHDGSGNAGLPDQHSVATKQIALRLPGVNVLVHGTVIDEQDRPVPRAWVKLGQYDGRGHTDENWGIWEPAPATLCATADDGTFTANLAAGDVHLLVYRQGFAPHCEVVKGIAGMPPLAVTLHPGGVLTGAVHDSAGKAITNASVELPYDYHPLRNSQITGDGTFRFDDLPRADLLVTVRAPDFPAQQRTFTFHGGEEQRWDVVLQATIAIHGRLVDHEGQPLAGWWLMTPGAHHHQITKADGRFTVVDCAADDNTLVAVPQPFTPVRMRFLHVQPMEREQTFTVPADSAPSAHLRGRCVGPDGAPLANAKLGLYQDGHDVQDDNDGCTADGSFDLGPLPPGRYSVTPFHPHWVFAPVAADVQASSQRDLGVCRGAEPARLVVHLLGEAELCKHAVVDLVADGVRHSDDFDSSNRTFGRVFPGRYRIVASVDGKERGGLDVDLAAGDSVERDVTLR